MPIPNTITENGRTYKLLTSSSTQSGIQHFKKGHGPGYWRYKTTSRPVLINGQRRNMYSLYGYRDWEYEKKKIAQLRQTGYLPSKGPSVYRQTGNTHTTIDQKRKAKSPGPRTSKRGRKYTERRKNRSDKPGLFI